MISDNTKLMICPDCCENNGQLWQPWYYGYQGQFERKCACCGKNMIVTNITKKEVGIISNTSTEWEFYKAMMKLKEEDIIEFNIKLSQMPKPVPFSTNNSSTNNQQNNSTSVQPVEDNRPKCPKCGSTSITTGARGVSGFWGFIGASKTVNRCANCGNTWKPR